jgi:hypothetical protein
MAMIEDIMIDQEVVVTDPEAVVLSSPLALEPLLSLRDLLKKHPSTEGDKRQPAGSTWLR